MKSGSPDKARIPHEAPTGAVSDQRNELYYARPAAGTRRKDLPYWVFAGWRSGIAFLAAVVLVGFVQVKPCLRMLGPVDFADLYHIM